MGFQRFHERWHQQLHQHIQNLKKAQRPATSADQNTHLFNLVRTFLSHLTDYYRVKSVVAQQDVLFLLDAPWATSFERSLHWLAGWRPTTAFQVLHTESTILFENRMLDILNGGKPTGDLADLTTDQFNCLSDLQCVTAKEENTLSDQLSIWQDEASEMMLMRYEEDITEKMKELAVIVEKADELRMRTLNKVAELLTPHQTVDFFIAATQLHSMVHVWGIAHDRQHGIN